MYFHNNFWDECLVIFGHKKHHKIFTTESGNFSKIGGLCCVEIHLHVICTIARSQYASFKAQLVYVCFFRWIAFMHMWVKFAHSMWPFASAARHWTQKTTHL